MKFSLLVFGTLCFAALGVFQTEGRVRDRVSSSVEIIDSKRKQFSEREVGRDGDRLKGFGFSRSTRTEEYYTKGGDQMLKTTYIYSASTSTSKLLKHVNALGKQFPKLFTKATVAEYHNLVARYGKGDARVKSLMGGGSRPKLQITFSVTRPAGPRLRRIAAAVLFAGGTFLINATTLL